MEIVTKWEEIAVKHEIMPIYIAKPKEEGNYPCVIVFQEVYGVTHHIREITEKVAQEGYIAICPDLFYHYGKGFEAGYDEMEKAAEQMSKFSYEDFSFDIDLLLEYIHQLPSLKNGLVSTLGFGLGGELSYLCACTKKINSAICFYGGKILTFLDQTSGITSPILLFYGDSDPYVTMQHIQTIKDNLLEHKTKADLYVYTNATHGFFSSESNSYNEDAAHYSWEKTRQFLDDTLK